MRFVRFLPVLAVALAALAALTTPAAFATRSVWAKGGQPTCTITNPSSSSSSTTCTGTPTGENGVTFNVNLDVSGVALYKCQDVTGQVTPGQNRVLAQGASTTPFTPTRKSSTFTTNPASMTAPSTVAASQAGCADGTTAVDPTLMTTKVQLTLAPISDGTLLLACASDPNGLSGTIALASC